MRFQVQLYFINQSFLFGTESYAMLPDFHLHYRFASYIYDIIVTVR